MVAESPRTIGKTTKSAAQVLKKRSHLKNFPSIHSPSHDRDTNRATFGYRLSELVFGSLLASYVLGFMGFAAVHGIPAFSGGFQLSSLLKTLFTWNIAMIIQVLMISLLFSAYTALLYVNFHQSILYLSQNQRKSSFDFMLAIAIGFGFGLAMIFPLSTMLWLGLLSVGVFYRRSILISEYADHVAHRIAKQARIPFTTGGNPGDDNEERKSIVKPIIEDVIRTLKTSNHPTIRSWVGRTSLIWTAVAFMIALPSAAAILEALYIWKPEIFSKPAGIGDPLQLGFEWVNTLLVVNICYCTVTSLILLWRLRTTSADIPIQEEAADAHLDATLNALLKQVKDRQLKFAEKTRLRRKSSKVTHSRLKSSR